MSGSDSYPPPGGQPPVPQPQEGWFPAPGYPPPGGDGQGYVPGGYPPPAGAANQQWAGPGAPPPSIAAPHKPGAIPLRPLGLGDIYDAAFKIIRFNPQATVGASVIVTSVAMLIPVLVTAVLAFATDVPMNADAIDNGQQDMTGLVASYVSLLVGTLLQTVGMFLVTGMNAHVAMAAAIGRRLSMGEAWAATQGRRWRLAGLTTLILLALIGLAALIVVLIALVGVIVPDAVGVTLLTILLVIGGGALFAWVFIRALYLAVPPLMLEEVTVFGAFGRAFRLTRRQFWRTFGIALLTLIITQVAGGMLSTPVSLVGLFVLAADPGGHGFFWFILANAVGSVLSAAIISPFTSTVTSLQYIDQRIRKEAFDLELMGRAGILAS